MHLKNFWTPNPKVAWDRHQPDFWKTSRFCDLADGNTGLDVGAVLAGLTKIGYDGWIAVEEDHPQRDVALVWRDNLMACQFHPEKSQRVGLAMYANFADS